MEQKYELRALKASDFFLVTSILSKIGVKDFKGIFESNDIKAAIRNAEGEQGGEIADADVASIGMIAVFDVAGVILKNMDKCETDIYRLLSSLSGMEWTEIREMPLADFGGMVVAVIKHEGFRDFFTAVVSQFK